MLAALDNLLLPAVRAAVGSHADVLGGPAGAPPDGSPDRVTVFASRLGCGLPAPCGEGEPGAPGGDETREPAFLGWQGILSARADAPLDFPLPPEADGELTEVQSPPGRLLGAGDAYLLDGRTLRFFRAPAGPVLARTRGARSAGYRVRSRGRIELDVVAWSRDGAALDRLLAQSLGAVLAAFESLTLIELSGAPPLLGVRLLHPRVRLDALTRQADPAAPGWLLGRLHCPVEGELELALTLGAPEPEGRIARVALALQPPGRPPAA